MGSGVCLYGAPFSLAGPWAMFRSRSAAKAKEEASSALAPFEVQALFIRTKGAGNTESWPDVLTLRAPSGVASKAPFATRSLKRQAVLLHQHRGLRRDRRNPFRGL